MKDGNPLEVLHSGGRREQFRHGKGRPLFDAIYPVVSLPTAVSPPFQGALMDGFITIPLKSGILSKDT